MPGFAGKMGNIFQIVCTDLPAYIHKDTEVLMVLFDGCDMEMIETAAARNGFHLPAVCLRNKNMLEKNFIYKIEKNSEWR